MLKSRTVAGTCQVTFRKAVLRMRLFLAVNPKESSRDRIIDIIDEMKAAGVRGNFTKPENLHITLVFLGEIPPGRVGDIIDAMRQVKEKPFTVRLSGIGNFSDTWWIGVEKSEPLWRLQKNLSEALSGKGFRFEKRAYRPNLTICRRPVFSDTFDINAIRSKVKPMVWDVDRFDLMLSERIDGQLKYSVLHSQTLE